MADDGPQLVAEEWSIDIADLQAVCSGLGEVEDGIYVAGSDCLECVQDLQRYLRADDLKKREAFHLLASWHVLQRDLLALLCGYSDESELMFELLKLLVIMTMPLVEETLRLTEMVGHLNSFKDAFCANAPGPLGAVVKMLMEPLSHSGSMRTALDNILIELVLTLFRNLLTIPEAAMGDLELHPTWTILHATLLTRLAEEHVLETLVFLTQTIRDDTNRTWNFLLSEVIYLAFRTASPDVVLSAPSAAEEEVEVEEATVLRRLLDAEHRETKEQRLSGAQLVTGGWQPRFRGAYVTRTLDSSAASSSGQVAFLAPLGGDELTPAATAAAGLPGRLKGPHIAGAVPLRRPRPAYKRRRRYAAEIAHRKGGGLNVGVAGAERDTSATSDAGRGCRMPRKALRVWLDFAVQFLDAGCFEELTKTLVEDLFGGRPDVRMIETDKLNFVWIAAFFTGFVRRVEADMLEMREARRKDAVLRPVQASTSNSTDGGLQVELSLPPGTLTSEAADILGSTPATTAQTPALDYAQRGEVAAEVESLFPSAKAADEGAAQSAHASAQSAAVQQGGGTTGTSELAVESDAGVRDVDVSAVAETLNLGTMQEIINLCLEAEKAMDYTFGHVCVAALHEMLQTLILLTQSRVNANVRNIVVEGDLLNLVVQLLRTWQSTKHGLTFLRTLISLNHALLKVHELVSTRGTVVRRRRKRGGTAGVGRGADGAAVVEEDEELEERAEAARRRLAAQSGHVELRFDELLAKCYGIPHVISNVCFLLARYRDNSPRTNAQLAVLLHRIAVGAKRIGLLYQLSVLHLFQRILCDQQNARACGLGDLFPLIHYVVRSLVAQLQQRPALYTELIFWKDPVQALELSGADSALRQLKEAKASRVKWTEDKEITLRAMHARGESVTAMSAAVGKPEQAVLRRLAKLGLPVPLNTAAALPVEGEGSRIEAEMGVPEWPAPVGDVREAALAALQEGARPPPIAFFERMETVQRALSAGPVQPAEESTILPQQGTEASLQEEWQLAVLWLAGRLDECAALREGVEARSGGEAEYDQQQAADYTIVPLLPAEWRWIRVAGRLLGALEPPEDPMEQGQHCFPRVDAALELRHLREVAGVLRAAGELGVGAPSTAAASSTPAAAVNATTTAAAVVWPGNADGFGGSEGVGGANGAARGSRTPDEDAHASQDAATMDLE